MEAAFDAYFRAADLDRDGRISGQEAIAFFKGSGLPQQVLAQIWTYADKNRAGFLGREDFYNSLKLVTVAQSGRELTPNIVKSALFGPAASKVPAPRINISTSVPPTNSAPSPLRAAQVPVPSQQNPPQGSQGFPSASLNSQILPSTNLVRPPQGANANTLPTQGIAPRPPLGGSLNHTQAPNSNTLPTQGIAQKSPLGGSLNHISSTTPNLSTDWFSGKKSVSSLDVTSQAPTGGVSPQVSLDSIGISAPGTTPLGGYNSPPPSSVTYMKANSTDRNLLSSQPAVNDSKALVPSGNGFTSDSTFGVDPFSATQAKQDSSLFSSISNSVPSSTALGPAVGPQHPPKPMQTGLSQGVTPLPAHTNQLQQSHSTPKQNQYNAIPSGPAPITANVLGGQIPSTPNQPQLSWPKITQADVRKYMIVFIKVDRDRDGKITGEEARNLFLSWKLPREILRKVWELSDQDKDGMLSFREFCTAVYLMERYREQRPLPDVLPDGIWAEGVSLPSTGQFSENHSGPAPHLTTGLSNRGMQGPLPGMPPSSMKPPQSPLLAKADDPTQTEQQKSKIPVLEKHLIDQLSKEEQQTLESKFKEASEADKKVQDLEKEILDSKEKTEFYRSKMQELIMYKSRCDNRFNEVSERMSADKREVQSLAIKYEEKCKKVGDVASKLTMDEATFRGIQEKKLEIYNAIVKLQKGQGNDEKLQEQANQIQSDLEELVKSLNEQCKRYGLKTKPTTLVEVPFGWQAGIQETAAVWDEEWDKFGDDGFSIIKELTVEEEHVVKESPPIVEGGNASTGGAPTAASTEKEDNKSEKSAVAELTAEPDSAPSHSKAESAKSPPTSPAKNAKTDGPDKKQSGMNDVSPRATESISGRGLAESSVSGDKNHDEHSWGPSFDHGDDSNSLWNFGHKESVNGGSHDLFLGIQGLPPIKTGASTSDSSFGNQQKPFFDSVPTSPMQKPFFDSMPSTPMQKSVFDYSVPSTPMQKSVFDYSVPSTPMQKSVFDYSVPSTPMQKSVFDSVPSTPMQKPFFDSFPSTPMQRSPFEAGLSGTQSPSAGNVFGKEQKGFFSSIPSTPTYNSSFSPRYSEAGDDNSFDHLSQFDSFGAHENNLFGQRDSFSRFDSFRSTTDHGGNDTFARFDSFRSTADQGGSNSFMRYDSISDTSDHDRNETFTRFDSIKGTGDHNHGFSFDDDDPFGTGPFKSSETHSPTRHGTDKWSAF